MHRLDNATYFTSIDVNDLRGLYAYPERLERPWIRVNFVSSIDGCVSVDGVSGGLGTPADKTVFHALRELCDVVIVGAGTARLEDYGGVQLSDESQAWRIGMGLSPVPPLLIVSARASIDPTSRAIADSAVSPILVVGQAADAEAISRLRDAGADVQVCANTKITGSDVEAALSARGLHRGLCEGGPSLFGQLIEDSTVDELCITTSPRLVGGGSGRISLSANTMATPMRIGHMLADADGTILTRWVRQSPRQ